MTSGLSGKALILSIATRSVAVTSGFAGLSKPMWVSLIWTKVKSPPFAPSFFEPLGKTPPQGHACAQSPNQAGPRPCHTLQESAAVDTVIVEIVQFLIDQLLVLICHFSSVLLLSH